MGIEVLATMTTGVKILIALSVMMIGLHLTTERRLTKIESNIDILLKCFSSRIQELFKSK